jgi:hypothetical protein
LWAREEGYEILDSREECPDFRVRRPNGDIEGIEAEKLASDFNAHGHDPEDADRIVCWRDDLGEEAPLPVIQLETYVDAKDSLRNPRYVLSESGSIEEGWFNQFLIWEDDGTAQIKFRYYQHEDGKWKQKSSATPSLTATQFSGIFGQIPANVRLEAFCDASFDALREYVENNLDADAFSDSANSAIDLGTFHKSDGGRISFGVMKSSPAFAIRAYNNNNTYKSQGAVQLYESDYPRFFEGVPEEIAKSLFLDLDVQKALEQAKEQRLPTANQLKPANRDE